MTTKEVAKLTFIEGNKLWGLQADGNGSELCPVDSCDFLAVGISGYDTRQLGVLYRLISRELFVA
jgi:hypothetical protein